MRKQAVLSVQMDYNNNNSLDLYSALSLFKKHSNLKKHIMKINENLTNLKALREK